MECVPWRENETLNSDGTLSAVKPEPENEYEMMVEPDFSVMANESSFERIKDEVESDEEVIERPLRKRRKSKKSDSKNAVKNGKSEWTELPCIINIKSSAVLDSYGNHNGFSGSSNGKPHTSSQPSTPQRIGESYNEDGGQSSSNNNFTSKVYEMLVHIQSTLNDVKEAVENNSKKIDQLQKCLPHPSWDSKKDFNFPITTEEQLLEFDNRLQNKEFATKLIMHLTNRTYNSWKEMTLSGLKYMLSRKVAVLYNLNGVKGTKKKFRDFRLCNILVESVQYKFKEALPSEILKKISLTLAGARDWEGSRYKKD